MGLLDYYSSSKAMTEEEVNAGLREEAAERKRKALTRVETLDLSHTTWPELPHPRIVNAITYVARRGLHRYPHLRGSELRDRAGRTPRRGARPADPRQRRRRAAQHAPRAPLIEPGQQLLTTWPSYPLYPLMARRAHGQAVPVSGGVDALLEAAAREPDVRVDRVASPNDPTGELLSTVELARLLDGLPGDVAVLLDEALVEFADAQPPSASLELLESHPRLLVFRSFSKAWGLAGLRVGYAIGGPGASELLAELEPDLGVSEVSQAGALEALRSCSELIDRRVATIQRGAPARDRRAARAAASRSATARPTSCGRPIPYSTAASSPPRLAQAGVLVAAGDALGEPRHVRIALRSRAASDRLLGAVAVAVAAVDVA